MEKTDEECIKELEHLFHDSRHLLGQLDRPTQAGLLAIARKGKVYWNAWRRAYPDPAADFSKLGISSFRDIDFSGFEFSKVRDLGSANFSGAHLGEGNLFEGAIFRDHANFNGTIFGAGAMFKDAIFEGNVDFYNATFVDSDEPGKRMAADFSGCKFEGDLHIHPRNSASTIKFGASTKSKSRQIIRGNSRFGNMGFVTFTRVFFNREMHLQFTPESTNEFKGCTFRKTTIFSGKTPIRLEFIDTDFLGWTSFKDCEFIGRTKFLNAVFIRAPDFSKPKSASEDSFNFHDVEFAGCWFFRGALFRNRQFRSTALFTAANEWKMRRIWTDQEIREFIAFSVPTTKNKNFHTRTQSLFSSRAFIKKCAAKTVFFDIPDFHGCKFHQDTSFVGTEFEVPDSNDAARAFRTLKLAMEGLKSIHEEQMFFRLEMKADRPSLPGRRRWISSTYRLISDYGYSLRNPFLTLIVCMIAFGGIHGMLSNLHHVTALSPEFSDFDSERTYRWLRYVMINTIPAPGFDKTQMDLRAELFGKDGHISTVATLLEMLHKIVSLGCVFLLGLALRNLFKMKA